jgi:FlaG/FlaF family flagellin (archaellin)
MLPAGRNPPSALSAALLIGIVIVATTTMASYTFTLADQATAAPPETAFDVDLEASGTTDRVTITLSQGEPVELTRLQVSVEGAFSPGGRPLSVAGVAVGGGIDGRWWRAGESVTLTASSFRTPKDATPTRVELEGATLEFRYSPANTPSTYSILNVTL